MKWSIAVTFLGSVFFVQAAAQAELKVGAAAVDVSPVELPVLINGGMTSRSADKVTSPIYARALVLDDGRQRVAIVVVDSCMMPRDFLDEVKQLASQRTGIRPDRMLMSVTHTHSAPSVAGALGTDADPSYVPYLRGKLVEAIAAAAANLEPAQVGWASADAAAYTALRRWIRRPDRIAEDPFGNPTVRANMHAGSNWDDVTGESGPEDPELSLIAFQSLDGRPIALLANFSMHYFSGVQPVNPDYFGLFCGMIEKALGGGDRQDRPFVAIMSHGPSGDIWRRDYTKPASAPENNYTLETYSRGLADIALAAYRGIQYDRYATLAMAEARIPLKYRVPDKQRLEWAQRIVEAMGDRPPKTTAEVYAREQIFLQERQSTKVVVQALRIGQIGIATTPTETYALTGLKIKLQSPLSGTMVIELANGGDGYIPPPEQHVLGGYNTWPARSAGLEVAAEPKITETALELLEQVSGKPRRVYRQSRGPAVEAILGLRPLAYWRLDEWAGPRASDCSGSHYDGFYEPGVVFFLEGPRSDLFSSGEELNRAAHFAGGRLRTHLEGLGPSYSVALWLWNGMPVDARETTGWILSRERDHGLGPWGDHVGLGGTATKPGRIIFLHGKPSGHGVTAVGRTDIPRWSWNHLVFVRDGDRVRIYLNGNPEPEIDVASKADFPPGFGQLFFGGRSDNQSNWEGRLDEIAVFDRALTGEDVQKLNIPAAKP